MSLVCIRVVSGSASHHSPKVPSISFEMLLKRPTGSHMGHVIDVQVESPLNFCEASKLPYELDESLLDIGLA